MSVIPFPIQRDDRHGIIHVTGDLVAGFEVAHESGSGSSWGHFSGPFKTGQEAITAAFALNRDILDGECNVFVCDAAKEYVRTDVSFADPHGDF